MATIPPHIGLIAGQLLPKFIPKNENETTLTFQFTVAPSSTYRVNYHKTQVKGKAVWQLVGCEEVDAD
ncbi:hypothetical protein BEL04_14650 [Mucilaginibacter sp. PPCGB 2223]|uniref:hypothetical protein n=1 Tax=Mucilaginibacter sp. PPCGB 2223 TaxID=1886027 RepID=UPI0008268F47|nr:hypothetical protein [Mucilaginibacter sp. PPCGB 2223]OCX52683.1 hypothetical protein BEL04_14650 [Mucilaginibacter sp. PPCGB 2223]